MIPMVRVPAGLTLGGLLVGLVAGALASGTVLQEPITAVARPIGTLWLHALQMTIVPLVAGLMFGGVVEAVAAAEGGALARRTLLTFALVLAAGTMVSALLAPVLLALWPVPQAASAALSHGASASTGSVPGVAQFLGAIVPENVIDAASRGAVLPVLVFVTLFALASTRLPEPRRGLLADLFSGIAGAMMVVIGWVLTAAPLGVFALGFVRRRRERPFGDGRARALHRGRGRDGRAGVRGGYGVAAAAGVSPGRFFRVLLPVQALAVSTQSSLACLPAMLAACRRLGVRESTAEFVLPLAVTLFRATSPAMNLAVAIYAAELTGTPLHAHGRRDRGGGGAADDAAASVSLPGTISFIARSRRSRWRWACRSRRWRCWSRSRCCPT